MSHNLSVQLKHLVPGKDIPREDPLVWRAYIFNDSTLGRKFYAGAGETAQEALLLATQYWIKQTGVGPTT